jgi:hypothetical protein
MHTIWLERNATNIERMKTAITRKGKAQKRPSPTSEAIFAFKGLFALAGNLWQPLFVLPLLLLSAAYYTKEFGSTGMIAWGFLVAVVT